MDTPTKTSQFRSWMAHWATGVSVVTARAGKKDFGLTVNAFLSVTLTPPRVLISLATHADTTAAILTSRRYAVNILAHDQQALARRFASSLSPEGKFRGVVSDREETGIPLLRGTLGTIACHLEKSYIVGDHYLFIGCVDRISSGREVNPLLFYRSRYAVHQRDRDLRLPPRPSRSSDFSSS